VLAATRPVITRYEVEPAIGGQGSQIVNLVKDLARALSVFSIRVVETIPGKSCMAWRSPTRIARSSGSPRSSAHGLTTTCARR